MQFTAPVRPPPHVPDDLTIPQFLLDSRHPLRPLNTFANPWFIEEGTGRNIGFEEIRARTFGLANALSVRYKIRENDVVCIFSPNHVDYPIALWAIHRLGAVATCANPAYTADELKYQLELSEAKLLITYSDSLTIAQDAARAAKLPADRIIILDIPAAPALQLHVNIEGLVQDGLAEPPHFVERRLNPGEAKTKLALLSFSSGTTGRPKAVAIPHYALIANVIQMSTHGRVNEEYAPWEDRRYRPGDAIYAVLPFYHIYGAVVVLHFYLFIGNSLVISSRFNFIQMLKSIERYRVNHLALVPPMIVLLCKNPATKEHDLSSVRFVMSGAAPLSAELTEQLIKILPNASIGQAYGMTESCTTLTFPRLDMKICTLGSSGVLLPGVTAKVVKEDGTLAGFNEQGELYVKAPSVALGYYKNPEATQESFGDGWLRTGDEVIIDKNYETFVVDRRKEIFKVRGYQVAPAELEGHLLNHPDVTDTCVVGIPDEYSGEVPLAFVVPSPAALERINKDPAHATAVKADLIKFVADAKVHYKRLAGGVEFIDAIPKNPSGKLLRRFLREKAKDMKRTPQPPVRPKL